MLRLRLADSGWNDGLDAHCRGKKHSCREKKLVCCLHKKRQETIRNRNLDDVSMEDLIKEVQEHGKCKCYIFFYLFQTIGYLFTKVKSFPPNKK